MSVEILERRFTYADYRELDVDDNFLYELLEGELVRKSAPSISAFCVPSMISYGLMSKLRN